MEVTIFHQGQPILRELLTSNLTLGSTLENDICLLDGTSAHHARLEISKETFLVVELEGPVFANGERVIGSRILSNGDMFDIGAYRCQLLEASPLSKYSTKTAIANLQGSSGTTSTFIPTLQFLTPIKRKFRRARFTLGRSPASDLILDNEFVSAQHAEIFVQNENYFIRDLHSRNGTYINDFKVSEKALPLSGIIRLGRYSLSYQIERSAPVQTEDIPGIRLPAIKPGQPERMLVGQSPAFQTLMKSLKKIAPTNDSVLLLGETGVGKDLLAHYLHTENPQRQSRPFVVVNCAAIPPTLADSQLFGHVKGAFSGAVGDHRGFFQEAHQGTLFLDEIGELSAESQARLLRVIEDGLVRPVGGTRETQVDIRMIFATNRDLDASRYAGNFREDLYERFHWVVRVPPLKDRLEDIPHLVRYFVHQHAPVPLEVHPDVPKFLDTLTWRGNIRALNRAVRRSITNAVARGSSVLEREDFDFALEKETADLPPSKTRQIKRESLLETLRVHKGNITHAAKALGVSRVTIHNWIKQEGINLKDLKL